ncbi:hypothetical protein EV182_002418 [Spiromyces aspiralis]|uniref:Uncharacterized protein n=1 Tax=Spiromyces aspiralis TaxID=68401 RepID=A0ACC1HVJ2_9FUNG|nr:hypothetical protein EV182_002418 [Spiromyces aspiralis]
MLRPPRSRRVAVGSTPNVVHMPGFLGGSPPPGATVYVHEDPQSDNSLDGWDYDSLSRLGHRPGHNPELGAGFDDLEVVGQPRIRTPHPHNGNGNSSSDDEDDNALAVFLGAERTTSPPLYQSRIGDAWIDVSTLRSNSNNSSNYLRQPISTAAAAAAADRPESEDDSDDESFTLDLAGHAREVVQCPQQQRELMVSQTGGSSSSSNRGELEVPSRRRDETGEPMPKRHTATSDRAGAQSPTSPLSNRGVSRYNLRQTTLDSSMTVNSGGANGNGDSDSRTRESTNTETQPQAAPTTTTSSISSLSSSLSASVQAKPVTFKCAVCLDSPDPAVALTGCGHVFCEDCALNAIFNNHKCPVCRKQTNSKQVRVLQFRIKQM